MIVKRLPLSLLLLIFLPAFLFGQVNTFEEVIGHKVGDRITKSYQAVQYLQYLEQASDRVVLREIGTTYNHKLQVAAIVTHPDNHGRLAEIQQNGKLLDDPRQLTQSEANQIIRKGGLMISLHGTAGNSEPVITTLI